MPEFDIVIKGGTVIDGRRNPRLRADVAVKDGKICEIGRIRSGDGARVIDASGLNVAPGFVDLHTHYDAQLFWDPYLSLSGWHGVTSVVIGNCGFGFVPVAPEMRERAMLTMTRNEAISLETMREGMPWDWVTIPEYLDSVERAPKAVNVLPYVPLNPLMVWVMGLERAKAGELPTDAEHRQMQQILNDAMDVGCCGYSAQRLGNASTQRDYDGTPMVTDIMHDETMLALAEVLAARNEGFIEYTYVDETSKGFMPSAAAMAHIERVAEVSGRPLIWNNIQPGSTLFDVLEWFRGMRNRGLSVYGQANHMATPSIFFRVSENFQGFDTLPTWAKMFLGPKEGRRKLLEDPSYRAELRATLPESFARLGNLENWVVFRGMTPETERYNEMRLKEIAAEQGKDVLDVFCDLTLHDDLELQFYVHLGAYSDQRLTKALIDDPYLIAGVSDGGAHTKYATTSSYATEYITEYVREHAWLSLEEVHWRLSAFPAYCGGFKDRGTLAPGAPADIVVYDFEHLEKGADEVSYDLPAGDWRLISRPTGYRHILVNGEVTIEDDTQTGATGAGQLLRHGEAGRSSEQLLASRR